MALAAALLVLSALAGGCGSIPGKYVRQAEWVTLTQLRTHPELYRGKTIILGGVIVMQRAEEGRVWLLVRNRPLDQDYMPHRAAVVGGIEDGHYWIVMAPKALPRGYQHWGRITVVGKVGNQPPPVIDAGSVASTHPPRGRQDGFFSQDPILYALYLRGWSLHEAESTWEASMDPSYIPSTPPEVKIE
jgi:hypothetical protein